ncbi:bifunctional adenosylcobinamide kinase/adenosylcobinamide-phosphate guanylyltransferase [Streptomyces lonarensis]
MDVTLLGTGDPAGLPRPDCPCAACSRAAAGRHRAATSVLVDQTLLLDLTPGAAMAAARAGRSLHAVRQVLLTHPHDGPAVEFPDDLPSPVRVPDGRELTLLGGHRVRAVALDAPGTGYEVTGPDGRRLLYLPPGGGPAGLGEETEGPYDLVLLDVAARPDALARLRAAHAVTWTTDIVAVHLGHDAPDGAELVRRLAAAGARAVPDGTALRAGDPPDAPEVPRRTLLLGAPGSGVSQEAERRLATFPEVLRVLPGTAAGSPPPVVLPPADDGSVPVPAAVLPPAPGARTPTTGGPPRTGPHALSPPAPAPTAESHPWGWTTTGTNELLPLLAEDGPPLLVDSLTRWLAATHTTSPRAPSRPGARPGPGFGLPAGYSARLAEAVRRSPRPLVLVSDQPPPAAPLPGDRDGRFAAELERLNTAVARECEEVLLIVAGLPVRLRG